MSMQRLVDRFTVRSAPSVPGHRLVWAAAALVLLVVAPASGDSITTQVSGVLGPDTDTWHPDIAYSTLHDEYMVVWHYTAADGHRSVFGQRVARDGDLIGNAIAIAAGGSQGRAAVTIAYNETRDEYFVAYQVDDYGDDQVRWEIWGRTVSWDGSFVGAERSLAGPADASCQFPKVAWNPHLNNYLVVHSRVDLGGSPRGVWSSAVWGDGHLMGSQKVSGTDLANGCDVAYHAGAQRFQVVWRELISGREVMGRPALVVPPGFLVLEPELVVAAQAAGSSNVQQPRIAAGVAFSAVTWREQVASGGWDIRCRVVHSDMSPAGAIGRVTDTVGLEEEYPDVVARPGHDLFWLTWMDGDWGVDGWYAMPYLVDPVAGLWSLGGATFTVATGLTYRWKQPTAAASADDFFDVVLGDPTYPTDAPQHVYGGAVFTIHVDGFESGDCGGWCDHTP